MTLMTLSRLRPLYAPCDHGLETLLASELSALGASDVEIKHRGVAFTGNEQIIWRANLYSRYANRILIPLAEFEAIDKKKLYQGAKRISWDLWITAQQTILVDASSYQSEMHHTVFISQVVKDAVCDYFRDRVEERPNVQKEMPDLPINVHLANNQCTISLDSSGERLHKRVYRQDGGLAPMKETLAAALLKMAGWKPGEPLIDLFCGSGTFLIEGALASQRKPISYLRLNTVGFAFEKWISHSPQRFNRWIAELPKNPPIDGFFWGSDLNTKQLQCAKDNGQRAQVNHMIHWEEGDFEVMAQNCHTQLDQWYQTHQSTTDRKGLIILNLPYGQRLKEIEELKLMFRRLTKTLKTHFSGFDLLVFVAQETPYQEIGFKAQERIYLRNGAIDCVALKYQLYAGYQENKKESL
jgi:putative N6-adenine-specific DNA methylase